MARPMAAAVEVARARSSTRPTQVQVTETTHRGATLVELTVAAGDAGKVIGRQGRTAEALRTLVAATAHHHGVQGGARDSRSRTCGRARGGGTTWCSWAASPARTATAAR